MSNLSHDQLRKYLDEPMMFEEAFNLYDSFHHPKLDNLPRHSFRELERKLLSERIAWVKGVIMDYQHPQCSEETRLKLQAAVGKYMIESAVGYIERYDEKWA